MFFVIVVTIFSAVISYRGPSINDVTHLGGRGDLPKGNVTTSLFIKKGDKVEGGVKNIKKWVKTSFMDGPLVEVFLEDNEDDVEELVVGDGVEFLPSIFDFSESDDFFS